MAFGAVGQLVVTPFVLFFANSPNQGTRQILAAMVPSRVSTRANSVTSRTTVVQMSRTPYCTTVLRPAAVDGRWLFQTAVANRNQCQCKSKREPINKKDCVVPFISYCELEFYIWSIYVRHYYGNARQDAGHDDEAARHARQGRIPT